MVDPTPISDEKENSDDGVKYATASRQYSDSSDISATFSLVDSMDDSEDSEQDTIKWAPDYAEPIHIVDHEDDDEVIGGFEDADDYDEDDEEIDTEEIPVEE